MAARQVVDTLNSILLQSKPGDSGSDDNSKGKTLPDVAPKVSAEALELLRDRIDLISETTADVMSDFLIFTLFPPRRPEAFSIKLHHLSLLDAPSRVTNAIAQLELLSASLGARQGVDERLNRIEQRKMREGVLRSLLESIYQELRVLRKQEKEDIDEPSTPINTSFGPSTPSSDEKKHEGEEDEEEEEEVSVHAFEQRIQDSAMPVDIKKRCLRMARALPMASAPAKDIEYLEWMLRLPWDKSTYDSPNAEKIDHKFLERAKAQLENDHFGIDRVKTRLLEYLAVLGLKYEQFDHEARLASQRSEENTVMQENLLELEGGAQTSVSHPKPKQFRYKGPIICLV